MALKISNLDRVERLRVGSPLAGGVPPPLGTLSVEGSITTGVPTVFSGQSANIAATGITGTTVAASYRISYTFTVTAGSSGAGAYATLTLAWTDAGGARTDAVKFLLTGNSYNTVLCDVASGQITVAVAATGSYGTAVYSLTLHAERLN